MTLAAGHLRETRPQWFIPPLLPFQRQRALTYLASHLQKPLRLKDLGAAVGLSPYYCSARFRVTMGCSPQQYLTRLRMTRAQQYLRETQASIQEIGRVVGFQDPEWFSKVFRRHVGLTPRAYRQQYHCAEAEQARCPTCLRPL